MICLSKNIVGKAFGDESAVRFLGHAENKFHETKYGRSWLENNRVPLLARLERKPLIQHYPNSDKIASRVGRIGGGSGAFCFKMMSGSFSP